MDMLSRVARKVAHDFNNYLSVILGYSSLLQLKLNTNPNYHEELEGIQRAGNQATDFTNKLLSIGRSYQKVRMETLLWANLIEDCVPLLERTLAPRCTLQVQTTSEDLRMHADSTQLRLLLSELTKNAKEAMPNGGVLQIRAQAVRRTQIENFPEELPGEHWIQIELADQGSGMAPEIKERIFEPFFTTKLEQKSDGLGCTLAYAIAHAHGGWIDVKSQPGQGSQFSIFLPQLA